MFLKIAGRGNKNSQSKSNFFLSGYSKQQLKEAARSIYKPRIGNPYVSVDSSDSMVLTPEVDHSLSNNLGRNRQREQKIDNRWVSSKKTVSIDGIGILMEIFVICYLCRQIDCGTYREEKKSQSKRNMKPSRSKNMGSINKRKQRDGYQNVSDKFI
jgi:hypothetical protein